MNDSPLRTVSMTQGNVDKVYGLEKESFAFPWSKRSFYEELDNELAFYEILEQDERAIAYAGMWIMFDEAHVTKIAVAKDMRGNGFGKVMMNHMISLAKAKGVTRMTLEVREYNTVAQRLYESLGFVVCGVRKRYYTDTGENGIIMWADI